MATGVLLLLLALLLAFQWWFRLASIERILPKLPDAGIVNAVLFALCGGCIALVAIRRGAGEVGLRVFGVLLGLVATLYLAENVADVDLGIDVRHPSTTPSAANPHPGRLSPNACLAYLALAVAFWLTPAAIRSETPSRWHPACLFIAAGIGAAGLLGHALQLELLFRWAHFNRLGPVTALALTLVPVGLSLFVEQMRTRVITSARQDERRIVRRSLAVLTLIAVSAGAAGFGVMRDTFDNSLSRNMLHVASTSADMLTAALGERLGLLNALATRPRVQSALVRLADDPNDADAKRTLAEIGDGFVLDSHAGYRFTSTSGAEVSGGHGAGHRKAAHFDLESAVGPAALLYEDGHVLEARADVRDGQRHLGSVVAWQRLPSFDHLLQTMRAAGPTTDVVLCSRLEALAKCAPSRFYPTGFAAAVYDTAGAPLLPIARAMTGERGVSVTRDPRGIEVIAAYAPVGSYGLGLVLKSDLSTAYGPLGDKLQVLIGLIVTLILLGGLVLQNQVRPLLHDLVVERERAKRARDEATRSLEVQAGVLELHQDLARSKMDVATVIGVAAEGALHLTGATDAAISTRQGDELLFEAVAGSRASLKGLRTELRGSLSELVMVHNTVTSSNDVQRDTRFHARIMDHFGAGSVIAAPLRRGNESIGALVVSSDRTGAFEPRDVSTLQIVAEGLNLVLQRAMATEALLASEAQYRLTFASSPLPMWIYDRQTKRFLDVNDAAVETYGFTREEFLSRAVHELRHRAAGERATGHFAQESDGPEVWPHALKDGSVVFVQTSANDILFHDRPARLVLAHDVTEQLAAESKLRSMNDDLEARVRDRTADLEIARFEAVEASRAKSDFVTTMSHEIRTPMNGVIGMIDVLERTSLDSEQTRLVELARESAGSLLSIIDDILDLSKIEAGKLELEREAISIEGVVRRACAVVTGAALASAVELCAETDPEVPAAVWGDNVRLRQILVNLAGNAIKFSNGRPDARVTVSSRVHSAGSGRVVVDFVVADNGIGMDRPTLDRLFKPFAQADASTTRKFGGTGLGLVITQRIMELMGGQILVSSEPGIGSVFTLRVPFDVCEDATVTAGPPLDAPGAAGGGVARSRMVPSERTELVLVAEDNRINREVITRQLRLLGYRSEVAADGLAALELWQSGRFDLVLTDLQMPGLDGYALAGRIRAEEKAGRRVPILALTANALKDEAARCGAAGMDGYLTKPITMSNLEGVLARTFQRRPRAEAPAPQPGGASGGGARGEVVDAGVLRALVGGDESVVEDLYIQYFHDLKANARAIRAAHDARDWDQVASRAHGLISTARGVGALRLGDICESLENAAKAREPAEITRWCKDFQHAATEVRTWILAQQPVEEGTGLTV